MSQPSGPSVRVPLGTRPDDQRYALVDVQGYVALYDGDTMLLMTTVPELKRIWKVTRTALADLDRQSLEKR